ncbi:MAG: hypothetical protein QOK15_616 [Nocardioidaceae bacterium]|nr:hypothetical protein [Nocardioidaceae bacterium]
MSGLSLPLGGALDGRKSLTKVRGVRDGEIDTVRAFNRVVTQRVGALTDRYLARDRPLSESRVLWEIGDAGCDVRTLRSRLGLDSGYLSRLLRSLEASGLVTVVAGERDKRVRTARLTRNGTKERALLDRRSDALARSMIGALGESHRERLVAAMAEVEKLLTASMVEIDVIDPDHAQARYCLRRYVAELHARFDAGFDPGSSIALTSSELRLPSGSFLVATLQGEPVGCGALRFHGDAATELKRMWVAPEVRGLGVGRRLLGRLESLALEHGGHCIRLETNAALTEAVALYRSSGYREMAPFNDEPYADHWFEKRLGVTTRFDQVSYDDPDGKR